LLKTLYHLFCNTQLRVTFDFISDTIDEITFLRNLKIHYSFDEIRYVDKWENISGTRSRNAWFDT